MIYSYFVLEVGQNRDTLKQLIFKHLRSSHLAMGINYLVFHIEVPAPVPAG